MDKIAVSFAVFYENLKYHIKIEKNWKNAH